MDVVRLKCAMLGRGKGERGSACGVIAGCHRTVPFLPTIIGEGDRHHCRVALQNAMVRGGT